MGYNEMTIKEQKVLMAKNLLKVYVDNLKKRENFYSTIINDYNEEFKGNGDIIQSNQVISERVNELENKIKKYDNILKEYEEFLNKKYVDENSKSIDWYVKFYQDNFASIQEDLINGEIKKESFKQLINQIKENNSQSRDSSEMVNTKKDEVTIIESAKKESIGKAIDLFKEYITVLNEIEEFYSKNIDEYNRTENVKYHEKIQSDEILRENLEKVEKTRRKYKEKIKDYENFVENNYAHKDGKSIDWYVQFYKDNSESIKTDIGNREKKKDDFIKLIKTMKENNSYKLNSNPLYAEEGLDKKKEILLHLENYKRKIILKKSNFMAELTKYKYSIIQSDINIELEKISNYIDYINRQIDIIKDTTNKGEEAIAQTSNDYEKVLEETKAVAQKYEKQAEVDIKSVIEKIKESDRLIKDCVDNFINKEKLEEKDIEKILEWGVEKLIKNEHIEDKEKKMINSLLLEKYCRKEGFSSNEEYIAYFMLRGNELMKMRGRDNYYLTNSNLSDIDKYASGDKSIISAEKFKLLLMAKNNTEKIYFVTEKIGNIINEIENESLDKDNLVDKYEEVSALISDGTPKDANIKEDIEFIKNNKSIINTYKSLMEVNGAIKIIESLKKLYSNDMKSIRDSISCNSNLIRGWYNKKIGQNLIVEFEKNLILAADETQNILGRVLLENNLTEEDRKNLDNNYQKITKLIYKIKSMDRYNNIREYSNHMNYFEEIKPMKRKHSQTEEVDNKLYKKQCIK